METIISVNNVSKKFRRYSSVGQVIKEVFHPGRKQYHQEFWALRDVDFEIMRGESVGIVGRNGSGKSTLLQIICGVLQPTSGTVSVNGRVAALLELGAGFHPEFSGRDNVYMNAALMGLSRAEMDERFDSVAEFADIGDFIDQPVRTYSSGMFVRLAFAAAISVDPDILVVDEALGVGDVAFKVKCMERIKKMQDSGVTILFVTQEPTSIKKFCNKGCWLNEGKVVEYGGPVRVADLYTDFMRAEISRTTEPKIEKQKTIVDGLPQIISIDMLNSNGNVTKEFSTGERVRVRLKYKITEEIEDDIIIGVAIYRNDDLEVCALNTRLDEYKVDRAVGEHELFLEYLSFNLLAGAYYLKAGMFHSSAMAAYDFTGYVNEFTVTAQYTAQGVVLMEHKWTTK